MNGPVFIKKRWRQRLPSLGVFEYCLAQAQSNNPGSDSHPVVADLVRLGPWEKRPERRESVRLGILKGHGFGI
jgi:hypothetical protein